MFSKLLLLFLSTILLVQSSLGKPLPSAEESTTPIAASSDVLKSPSTKLLVYVVEKLSQLADNTLAPGKKLIQDVIAEVSTQESKNEHITEKLELFSNFVKKIEKLESSDDSAEINEKFDFMLEFIELLEKSKVTSIEKPTSTDILFDDSLKKNGLSVLEERFEEKFATFAKDFHETADRILSSETVEAWPQKNKIQDWLRVFEAENDGEKKIAMFEKFFELLYKP